MGYLVGYATGGLTPEGFSLEGLPALVVIVTVVLYFVICWRFLRGTLWRHLLRAPQPKSETKVQAPE